MKPEMTREEIEQQMGELARKYVVTHDPEIFKELYQLSLELEKMRKLENQ
jgi:FKBP-type peptidyl-prolyl cis-trans isomerase (trigger factor)